MSGRHDYPAIIDEFVAAIRPRVENRLAEMGVEWTEGVGESLAEAEEWLRSALEQLVGTPFDEQRRSPLELLQEAMRFPTDTLAGLGVPVVSRDSVAVSAIPGDVYGLAPASSHQLGEDAWHAHLAWGAAKAAAMQVARRPEFGVFSSNLMDRSKFGAMLPDWEMVAWTDVAGIAKVPPTCFVDLQNPDADEAITALAALGAKVIAFGPHVDDVAMVRARSLGATDAVARSTFFRRLQSFLPKIM